jgi:hypothetical protein
MKIKPESKPLFDWIFDILLFIIAIALIALFLPSGFESITYTYQVFYKTTQQCFPNFARLAFALIIIVPHLMALAGLIYIYRLMASGTGFREIIWKLVLQLAKCLEPPYSKYILNKGKYETITNQNGLGVVFRQFIVTAIVTLIFIGCYFVLRSRIIDDEKFFEAQLSLSHWYLALLGVQLLAFVSVYRQQLILFLKNWFSEPGSAYNLAIFRIVIGFHLIGRYFDNFSGNSYWAGLPRAMRVNLPYMGWFIQNIPINPSLYHYATLAAIICAICICLGLFTRFMLIVNIPLGIYVLGVPFFFGTLFHTQVWVWFPAILAFSSCSDALSLDAIIKKWRGNYQTPGLHPKYRVPFNFIWLLFGIIYFFSGIGKLSHGGFAWALGPSMVNQVQIEWAQWYGKMPGIRIDHYPNLLHAGGMIVILFEIYYPFLIFTAAGRLIAFFGGLTLHKTLQYFIYIGFKDLQLTYVSYVNWQWFVDRFRQQMLKIPLAKVPSFNFRDLLQLKPYRNVFIIGTLLYVVNFTFGLLNINSWPFSAYPTYSAIVPSTRHYVHFEAYDKAGQKMIVYKVGQAAHFQMESFTPIEDDVQNKMLAADSLGVQQSVHKLWNIWLSNVPQLKEADSVAVYMRESPLIPEKLDSVISEKYLMSMKFR